MFMTSPPGCYGVGSDHSANSATSITHFTNEIQVTIYWYLQYGYVVDNLYYWCRVQETGLEQFLSRFLRTKSGKDNCNKFLGLFMATLVPWWSSYINKTFSLRHGGFYSTGVENVVKIVVCSKKTEITLPQKCPNSKVNIRKFFLAGNLIRINLLPLSMVYLKDMGSKLNNFSVNKGTTMSTLPREGSQYENIPPHCFLFTSVELIRNHLTDRERGNGIPMDAKRQSCIRRCPPV